MKKYCILFAGLFAMFFFISCQTEIPEIELQEKTDSLYTVSFSTADFEVNTDTRASSVKTIYGINIEYYKNGVSQGYYAYGLFDNISNASITLIGGYTYTFTCSIVRSADDELWYGPYSNNSFSGYAQPFQLNSSESTQCLNKFVEGTRNYLSGLGKGTSVIKSNGSYTTSEYPSSERYFGMLYNFNPATDGTKVVIPVNKAYFGCNFIVKGVEGGTLSVNCGGLFGCSTRTEDIISQPQIHTFSNVRSCWDNPNHTESFNISYDYTSDNKTITGKSDWNISGNKSIAFKRNVMTTITISVNPDLSGASLCIDEEALGEDNLIEFEVDENYNLYQKYN